MSKLPAPLVECFSSTQGEGTLVGLRQVFLRFAGCNLSCSYCDTPGTMVTPDVCQLELTPGRHDFFEVANPVPCERVVSLVERWTKGWPGLHHSISVTGGEPLLHAELLLDWLPELKRLLPIHLETNGTLPEALEPLVPYLDHIGMDIKLPSASGCPPLWDGHRRFLEIASRTGVFVKLVVGPGTKDWEIEKSCSLIAGVDRSIPLILQPMTLPDGKVSLSATRTLDFQELAALRLKEVRVIPQTHKFLGVL